MTAPNLTLAILRLQAIKERYLVREVPVSRTDGPSSQYSGDTHMAISITINILTQRMVNTSWHSPLTALTSCLNMLGGDMMSPVGRAEKAAEAEGSAPLDRKASAPW